jgi:hypothetical protein
MSWKSHLRDKQPYFEFEENEQKVSIEDIRNAKSLEELKGIGIPDSVIGAMKSGGVKPDAKHIDYMPDIWLLQNENFEPEKKTHKESFDIRRIAARIAEVYLRSSS